MRAAKAARGSTPPPSATEAKPIGDRRCFENRWASQGAGDRDLWLPLFVNSPPLGVSFFVDKLSFDGPKPCPVCEHLVFYKKGRRRCSQCRRWCHESCSVPSSRAYDSRSVCHDCLGNGHLKTYHLEWILKDLELWEDAARKGALVYIASIYLGQDEAAIATVARLTPEEVSERAQHLRDSQLWLPNGKLGMDDLEAMENDPKIASVHMILGALCAEGLIRREIVDSEGKFSATKG